jgi:hypothetical protein
MVYIHTQLRYSEGGTGKTMMALTGISGSEIRCSDLQNTTEICYLQNRVNVFCAWHFALFIINSLVSGPRSQMRILTPKAILAQK